MKRLLLFALPASLLFGACNDKKDTAVTTTTPIVNLDSAKSQINASNLAFGQTFAKNDSVAFVNMYTSDACIMPSNLPKMCGREAIGTFFSQGVKMGIRNIVPSSVEVMGSNDTVIETGTYDMQVEGGKSIDKGKYIVIWKQEDGKWKMYRDIWNSDVAPAGAPAQ